MNDKVQVVLLGVAQDGGVPQSGCSCTRCMAVHNGEMSELYPVSLGITDKDGAFHLVEASRTLSRQLFVWAKALQKNDGCIKVVNQIKSVSLTHLHLGHIDGLGIFGREVMGYDDKSVKLIASEPVIDQLKSRSLLDPFSPQVVKDKGKVEVGRGVTVEFHRVPHREEEVGDTHCIVVRGDERSVLFLPDHDTYNETLQWQKKDTIREWLKDLSVQIVLIDGTFYTIDEVAGSRKDASSIPHPSIETSLNLLGQRQSDDPEIYFIHLNHTNALIDNEQARLSVLDLGWKIGKQGQVFEI